MRDYKSRPTRRPLRARERLKCILYIAGTRAREIRRDGFRVNSLWKLRGNSSARRRVKRAVKSKKDSYL